MRNDWGIFAVDTNERTYYFDNEVSAMEFANHLNSLYGLNVYSESVNTFDSYDEAIEQYVEVNGPSDD